MGQGIVYCNSCGVQILASEFRRGRAEVVLGKNFCKDCAKAAPRTDDGDLAKPASGAGPSRPPRKNPPTASGPETPRDSAPKRLGSTRRIPKAVRPGFLPADRISRLIILAAGAILVLAAVVLLAIMSRA